MSAPVILSAAATKGGVGKTTLIANVSGVLADIGLRVLMIDCDVQPSLSKYYPISHRAPNGIVELLLGENTEEVIRSTISNTVFPNLDIVISNNISAFVETEVTSRPDRAFLLRSKLHSQYIQNNYDVVLIDTQGAVGPLLDTAAFAATCLLCPIMPEVLSAREFLTGTQELLKRLQKGEAMRIPMPQLRAIIYAQDRTNDAKFIASSIKDFFSNTLDDRRKLLSVAVPAAKAYKEATTLRVPVHCHGRISKIRTRKAVNRYCRHVNDVHCHIGQKEDVEVYFAGYSDMAACDSPSLFYLGRVSMTATVDNWAKEHLPAQLYDNNLYAQILLEAHRRGIWGDLPPEDAKLNQLALKPGEEGRIMSSYKIGDQRIWVITEWDRSLTTLLFPEDY